MRSLEAKYASAADLAQCRQLLRGGSKTFFAASLLLPGSVSAAATSVYGFCRVADDAVDLDGDEATLGLLQQRLGAIYQGAPADHPVDRAFAEMVDRFAIPHAVPAALLEGFAWDRQTRRYETIEELHAYAVRVAGTVGVMMSLLMGQREPDVVARACELGMAMQLTNIARDVGEDARAGRLYLPLCWLRETGVDPDEWMMQPVFDARIAQVVQRLLDDADELYRAAERGIAHLPLSCRPGIHAARLLYAHIGRAVESAGCDSVSSRAVVPLRTKLRLLLRAVATMPVIGSRNLPECPPPARFLIDAVVSDPRSAAAIPVRWWDVEARFTWLLHLFARLSERDRFERAPAGEGRPS